MVTPSEALDEAHRAGGSDRFYVTIHAREHRDGRNVHRADLRETLKSATVATLQNNGRWRLDGGRDLDGDDLTLIVVFDPDVVIITAF